LARTYRHLGARVHIPTLGRELRSAHRKFGLPRPNALDEPVAVVSRLPPVIDGDSVTLRRWNIEARAELQSAIEQSAAELKTWLPHGWAELNDLDTFSARASAGFEQGSVFAFAIFDHSEEVVGHISLTMTDPVSAEIGYWTRSDRTGSGYATAAVAAVTTAAFGGLRGVRRIQLLCDEANRASARVAAKNGYAHVGSRVITATDPPRSGREMIWVREPILNQEAQC
jgi:ribosomal-protein-serine acetyltransferase